MCIEPIQGEPNSTIKRYIGLEVLVEDIVEKLPIWKDKYEKMGVTPRELYMRQNGLCWLVPEINPEGNATVYCTDGKDKAVTANMLNPTIECIQCMICFTEKAIEREVKECRTKEESNDSGFIT